MVGPSPSPGGGACPAGGAGRVEKTSGGIKLPLAPTREPVALSTAGRRPFDHVGNPPPVGVCYTSRRYRTPEILEDLFREIARILYPNAYARWRKILSRPGHGWPTGKREVKTGGPGAPPPEPPGKGPDPPGSDRCPVNTTTGVKVTPDPAPEGLYHRVRHRNPPRSLSSGGLLHPPYGRGVCRDGARTHSPFAPYAPPAAQRPPPPAGLRARSNDYSRSRANRDGQRRLASAAQRLGQPCDHAP